jgi:Tfp pilus assembly protein PilX
MIYIKNIPINKDQRGATLLISLVMLVLLTLFAISAINLSSTNLSIVGNMQARMEAQAAGMQAIEQVMSSAANFLTPAEQYIDVDINNDGTSDFTAHVERPSCFSSKSLTNAELIPAPPATISAKDQNCISSVQDPGTGVFIANAPSSQSWCYDQKWEVTATVNDGHTGAQVKQHQGASLRVPAGTACKS